MLQWFNPIPTHYQSLIQFMVSHIIQHEIRKHFFNIHINVNSVVFHNWNPNTKKHVKVIDAVVMQYLIKSKAKIEYTLLQQKRRRPVPWLISEATDGSISLYSTTERGPPFPRRTNTPTFSCGYAYHENKERSIDAISHEQVINFMVIFSILSRQCRINWVSTNVYLLM